MNFDPVQEKEIKKTLTTIVKDMRALYQVYPYEDIDIGISMSFGGFGDYWHLIISGNSIDLVCKETHNVTRIERKGKWKKIYLNGELEAIYNVIMRYDDIRRQIGDIVTSRAKNSALSIQKLKDYQQKYSNEATIEIEVPETNNLHTLEVVETDGKKIGTLNFNGLKLRNIASDGIEIVNKTESKQKRK